MKKLIFTLAISLLRRALSFSSAGFAAVWKYSHELDQRTGPDGLPLTAEAKGTELEAQVATTYGLSQIMARRVVQLVVVLRRIANLLGLDS